MFYLNENDLPKLVRDNIPEIIRKSGRKVKFRKCKNQEELLLLLGQKLIEESKEFVQNQRIEELADILEIIHSVIDLFGISIDKLYEIRMNKKQINGGYEEGIILISTID